MAMATRRSRAANKRKEKCRRVVTDFLNMNPYYNRKLVHQNGENDSFVITGPIPVNVGLALLCLGIKPVQTHHKSYDKYDPLDTEKVWPSVAGHVKWWPLSESHFHFPTTFAQAYKRTPSLDGKESMIVFFTKRSFRYAQIIAKEFCTRHRYIPLQLKACVQGILFGVDKHAIEEWILTESNDPCTCTWCVESNIPLKESFELNYSKSVNWINRVKI